MIAYNVGYQLLQYNTMPFQKGNKLGFTSSEPLDRKPLMLKVKPGLMARIEKIPNWRNKLRQLIETWVEAQESQD